MTRLRRDLDRLSRHPYDVVVVGGGIFGISVAREAALRGLTVALVEKGDFAGATSSHSFRMLHGGIRYLQHGDLVRLRASSRERNILLRTAPHLVHPLPIVLPTYGRALEGKAFLRAGMWLYDALVPDRNRGIGDPDQRIPRGRSLSRDEVLARFPGIRSEGLTGGCMFTDGQLHHPARLAVAMLRSAAAVGTHAANYVVATGFLRDGNRVVGIEAEDRLTGEAFPVRGRYVVNATGAWAERLLQDGLGLAPQPRHTFSRDLCLVVRRPAQERGLAVLGSTRDPDAVVSRSRRHLFVVPWRDRTLVGVWHTVYERPPDDVRVQKSELREYVKEINESYPGFHLKMDEIDLCNAGLVLFGRNRPGAVDLSYGKRSRLIDHARADGVEGLMTLIGVRFTTARSDAEEAVDRIGARLGRGGRRRMTRRAPVFGGDFDSVRDLTGEVRRALPDGVGEGTATALARNYGSEFRRVLSFARRDPELLRVLSGTNVVAAEVAHAVDEEMAESLEDIVFRRTDLGIVGPPPNIALDQASVIAARRLGWSRARRLEEIARVRESYPLAPPLRPAGSSTGAPSRLRSEPPHASARDGRVPSFLEGVVPRTRGEPGDVDHR